MSESMQGSSQPADTAQRSAGSDNFDGAPAAAEGGPSAGAAPTLQKSGTVRNCADFGPTCEAFEEKASADGRPPQYRSHRIGSNTSTSNILGRTQDASASLIQARPRP